MMLKIKFTPEIYLLETNMAETIFKVLQINVLPKTRSTGRTTFEFHNYLTEFNYGSYVAYGIGKKDKDSSFYKITNKFEYYFNNFWNKLFGTQGFTSNLATRRLIKCIKRNKPNIVHLRNLHSNYINVVKLLSYLEKNPNIGVVLTTHDFWFLTGSCTYPKCDLYKSKCGAGCVLNNSLDYGLITKRIRRNFNLKKIHLTKIKHLGIQANSNYSLSIVSNSFLKDKMCEVIYNWIDSRLFYPDNSFSFCSNKKVILTMWSCLDEKSTRFKMLCSVAEILSDRYLFVAVGAHDFNTNKYPYLKIMDGVDDTNILRKYYSAADVFFNPSTTDTFGKVVAESLMCGTPAVVFNTQALPELIDEGCGAVIKEYSVDSAVETLSKFLSKDKKDYSENCILRARTLFDYHGNCKKLLEFYKKVLEK